MNFDEQARTIFSPNRQNDAINFIPVLLDAQVEALAVG